MDAGLAWTVIGSVAGVAALAVGVLQLRQARRDGGRDLPGGGGVLLPPGGRLPVRVRGRDELAGELAKLARVPDGRVHVLAGLGGSGKSTVALTLAQEVLRQAERRTAFRRRAMRVWWVPAADPASLTGALLGLAGKLGAAEGEVREALAGRLNPSDVLWPRLEAAGGWVLVLDNADDAAALTVGDRAAGEGAGWLRATRAGLVLVTSRISARQAWGPVSVIHAVGSLDDVDIPY
jgi:hypothetical protein